MAFSKKYAGLPDLDPSPDVYETPDLTDASTLPTATISDADPDPDDSSSPDNDAAIDRHHLAPRTAAARFAPAALDASNADFSDRVSGRRRAHHLAHGYRAYSRPRVRRPDGTVVLGDVSDEEEGEQGQGLEETSGEELKRRLARLRREAEEVAAEVARRKAEAETTTETQPATGDGGDPAAGTKPVDGLDDGVVELSRALDAIRLPDAAPAGVTAPAASTSAAQTAEAQLAAKLAAPMPGAFQQPFPTSPTAITALSAPPALISHAAEFDARLAALETTLGLGAASAATNNNNLSLGTGSGASAAAIAGRGPGSADTLALANPPILPTLSHLSAQLATLTATLAAPPAAAGTAAANRALLPSARGATAPGTAAGTATTAYIESLTTRIRKLTADADTLSSARRRAAEAARAATAARMAAAAAAADGSDSPAASAGPAAVDGDGNGGGSGGDAGGSGGGGGDPTVAEQAAAAAAAAAATEQSEQTAKLAALFATLPTITSLHPLLPAVLERLRSLRTVHARAAGAAADLDALERGMEEMGGEIRRWREGLGVVEGKVKEAEERMAGNVEAVGGWVRGLEGRVKTLQ